MMAGLYIHIPFCASRCIYCGFYSTTRLDVRQEYVDAVCREMALRKSHLPISTIYLGGGTPSQLTTEQLQRLLHTIPIYYKVEPEAEVTVECNPDDVTEDFAVSLKRLGVNRVSMGVQTFSDELLRFLHRRHTAAQVPQAVRHLRAAGIRNISIDLMYGFPNETLDDWQRDIDAALALDAEHLSAYCLMIEEGTRLFEIMRNEGNEEMRLCDEETQRAMYELLIDRLTSAGYEHYEISNFARHGYRSRHNSSYWNDVPYIGLGAAAHSYATTPATRSCATTPAGSPAGFLPVRSWNVSDLRQYMAAINRGERPFEQEVLDADTHYNDRIATALRTSDGLDLGTLSERHRHYCTAEAQRFLTDGLLQLDGQRLRLTRRGLFVSDMVMSTMMMI